MNRAERMQRVLRDGRWHSRREIQEREGWFLTNNAASELRARGLEIEQRRVKGIYEYRLSQGEAVSPSGEGGPELSALSSSGLPLAELVQLDIYADNDRWSRKA